MVLGMSLGLFTLIHVLLSLAGLGSGFIVAYGLLTGKRLEGWTAIFLTTTILTSATGYLFPVQHLLPSHIVGAISLIVLAVAVIARYPRDLAGRWRTAYVISALVALYLNVFVAVVQAFLKVPALHELAPKGNEPPFVAAQLTVMIFFIVLTLFAVKRFHSGSIARVGPAATPAH